MFGVVLWSDSEDNKAVIWCEDHGDLAFYHHAEETCMSSLDAGDWVQFDMTTDRNMRFAHNPRLIQDRSCPDIADKVKNAATTPQTTRTEPRQQGSADIIPFASVVKEAWQVVPRGASRHRA